MTRWHRGEQTVAFLIGRGRLESFEASDPAGLAATLAARAARRLEATARAALANGDGDGAYAAAANWRLLIALASSIEALRFKILATAASATRLDMDTSGSSRPDTPRSTRPDGGNCQRAVPSASAAGRRGTGYSLVGGPHAVVITGPLKEHAEVEEFWSRVRSRPGIAA